MKAEFKNKIAKLKKALNILEEVKDYFSEDFDGITGSVREKNGQIHVVGS